MRARAALVAVACLGAAPPGLSVTEAWTSPAPKGADIPLSMAIRNDGAADALLRARCAAATFTEPHVVDHGEGFPAMRAVKSLPVAAGSVRLDPDGAHVMLLQTTRALADGDGFECTVTFRDGGAQAVRVSVRQPAKGQGII